MAGLYIELRDDELKNLEQRAHLAGKPVEALVRDSLAGLMQPAPKTERERVREALRQAGLLAEPTPRMRELAAQATMTLEEVRAALDRVGGKPLSEVIIENRGPLE